MMSNGMVVSRSMERGILILFTVAGLVLGIALALPAVRQAVGVATGEGGFSLLTDAAVPHDGTADGPSITRATFDTAWVLASGLGEGTRALLALGAAFGALTTLLTVGAVTLFLLLLMWGRPFHRAVIVATQVAGCALLLGGMLSAGLGGLGRMMAASELNTAAGGVFVIGFRFDPAWALVGLGLLALSLVFRYGTRLQRDTEGLV